MSENEIIEETIKKMLSKKYHWTDKIEVINISKGLLCYNIFTNLRNSGVKREDMLRRACVLNMPDDYLRAAMKLDPKFFEEE